MTRLKLFIASVMLAGLLGCAGAGQKTGEFIDDSSITAKVKSRLFNDPVTGGWKITVITENGVVQLAGFVKSSQEKNRASELARGVDGVKAVNNNLVIK
ncbi:MAG: BON domain-containing protein [Gammaproteobacteria bacterium]|nr:BON domain-containing protein [Gammaproteobacteria bacterium]MDH3406257.1 BON domain-containing protein [Gammaproteobacteria bacterium]MDH5486878.1 BON domain-containing protein [Gammaproteobacteria bacterium]